MQNAALKQAPTGSVIIMDRNDFVNQIESLRDFIAEVGGARPIQKLLDSSELSQFLSTTPQTIAKLRAEGLPFMRLGELYRYDIDDVRQWLKSREKVGAK